MVGVYHFKCTPRGAPISGVAEMHTPLKLLFKAQVLERVGLSYTTIWKWMRQGNFPRSRVAGGKTCWIESEINAWIEARPVRKLKGDAE
jgi:prophage regulatory protein